ncbi:hypothetical protein [Parasitella parasitica]|uniref:Uncharacterized protein n=1 Tax=Parasitella parasitica TaxID=35722 RepID=A0A0B7NFD7_9FUNG|nr:hypothetical protein [Parasitella parasitica]
MSRSLSFRIKLIVKQQPLHLKFLQSEQTGLMPVVNNNEAQVKKFLNGFNQRFGVGKELASIEQLREATVAYGKELYVFITTANSSSARWVITLQCKHGSVYRAAY